MYKLPQTYYRSRTRRFFLFGGIIFCNMKQYNRKYFSDMFVKTSEQISFLGYMGV